MCRHHYSHQYLVVLFYLDFFKPTPWILYVIVWMFAYSNSLLLFSCSLLKCPRSLSLVRMLILSFQVQRKWWKHWRPRNRLLKPFFSIRYCVFPILLAHLSSFLFIYGNCILVGWLKELKNVSFVAFSGVHFFGRIDWQYVLVNAGVHCRHWKLGRRWSAVSGSSWPPYDCGITSLTISLTMKSCF